MPTTIAPDQAEMLLAPFVGARLRGDYSHAIDVSVPGCTYRNASIRAVDCDGLAILSATSKLDRIDWNDVRSVTIAALDTSPAVLGMGVRLSSREYAVAAKLEQAA